MDAAIQVRAQLRNAVSASLYREELDLMGGHGGVRLDTDLGERFG